MSQTSISQTASEEIPVGVFCTVIPDGVAEVDDSKGVRVNLSVILTPFVGLDDTNIGGCKVFLDKWVEMISEGESRGIKIYLGFKDGSQVELLSGSSLAPQPWHVDPRLVNPLKDQNRNHRLFRRAGAIWRRLFKGEIPKHPYKDFIDALKEDQNPISSTVASAKDVSVRIAGKNLSPSDTDANRSTFVARSLERIRTRLLALHLAQAGARDKDLAEILGSVKGEWSSEMSAAPFQNLLPRDIAELNSAAFTDDKKRNDPLSLLQYLSNPQPGRIDGFTSQKRQDLQKADNSLLIEGLLKQDFDPKSLPSRKDPALITANALITGRASVGIEGLKAITDSVVKSVINAEAKIIRNRKFNRAPRDDEMPDPISAARRKFVGVGAHPTLAKFLRLIYDIEVTIPNELFSQLNHVGAGQRMQGFLSAAFVDKTHVIPPRNPVRTAFVLEPGDSPETSIFEPCPRNEFGTVDSDPGASPQIPIARGFVNLRADDPTRFVINTVDVGAAVYGGFSSQQSQEEANRSGSTSTDATVKLPELKSRGFELHDKSADLEAVASLTYSAYRKNGQGLIATFPDPGKKITPFFAECLVAGYRVDVGRQKPGEQGFTWHTITGCDKLYAEIYDAYGQSMPDVRGPVSWHPFDEKERGRFRNRDDGFVSCGGMMQKVKEKDPKKVGDEDGWAALAVSRMFTWTGDPLGVPADQREPDKKGSRSEKQEEALWIDPAHDLAVDQEYRLDPLPERRAAALREGDDYRFALRVCYQNGSSRPFKKTDDVRDRFDLGSSIDSKKGVTFLRPEEIQAPTVLLLPDDPILKPNAAIAAPGSQSDIVILRTGRNETKTVRRVLVPPRVTFERAEQQCQLDNSTDGRPIGAFEDVLLDADTGAFPPAKTNGSRPSEEKRAQGLLYTKGRSNQVRKQHYYPDANARKLAIAFVRNGRTPDGFSTETGEYLFWKRGNPVASARPILLNFIASPTMTEGGDISWRLEEEEVDFGFHFGSTSMGRLDVRIAPAEEVELYLWCYDDLEVLCTSNSYVGALFQTLSFETQVSSLGLVFSQNKFNARIGALKDNWNDALKAAPIPVLNTIKKLRLIHAVPRPLSPPTLLEVDGAADIKIFLIGDPKTWSASVIETEIGGKFGFFTGNLNLHRRSTGEIRCEGVWLNYDSTSVVLHKGKDQDVWAFKPSRFSTVLFTIKDVDPNSEAPLGLLRDDQGNLRSLSYTFDGRARLIALRFVATSRFTTYFDEPSKEELDKQLGPFEAESGTRGEITAELLEDKTGRPISNYYIWLPATVRPPPPLIDRIEVILSEIDLSTVGRKTIVKEKSARKLRLWLREGSWYASGQGELLAILCSPKDLFDRAPSSLEEEQLASPRQGHSLDHGEQARSDALTRMRVGESCEPTPLLEKVITAWGANATMEGGRLPAVISPSSFSGYVAKRSNLTYVFSIPVSGPLETVVSLVAYQPIFDTNSGKWFVDVEFEPGPVDSPFVRFCLARYQPHAIKKCELSSHLLLPPREIPPSRIVEVDFSNPTEVAIQVTGAGYSYRAPFLGLEKRLQSLADSPLHTFSLSRSAKSSDKTRTASVRSFGRDGFETVVKRVSPVPHADGKAWNAVLEIPENIPRSELVVHVRESELQMPLNIKHAEDPELYPLVETPRLFACDIPLI